MTAIVGRNIFSLGLSRISSGVLLFIVQAKLAVYLGPLGFGKFSLVLAIQTIFLLFVDFGISRYVIKKISENREQASVYYGNFLIAQSIFASLVLGLFLLLPRLLDYDPEVTRAMYFTGVGLFFTALSIPALTLIQAWQKIHLFAIVIFVESLIKAIWFYYAIVTHKDLVFIFVVYLVIGVFDLAVWWFLTRGLARPKFTLDKKLIKTMLIFGIPFAMTTGFEILISKIDVVIQKVFLTFSDVGIYSAAYRFLDFLTFLPAIVAISLFPYLSERQSFNEPESKYIMSSINRYLVTLALPLGVGVTVLARPIILRFFGTDFSEAIHVFQILIWATVLTLLYAVPNVIMQVKRLHLAVFILAMVAVLNFALNWIFIPIYGILASAWLTVFSYLLIYALFVYHSRILAGYDLWHWSVWPAVWSAIMGSMLWYFRDLDIFIIIPLAILLYFGGLFGVRFLTKNDLQKFYEFINPHR